MNVLKDIKLADILWYKVGGVASRVLECESREDVVKALDYIEKNHIKKFFVVGLGSNLLFSDEAYDGAVIRIVRSGNPHIVESGDNVIEGYAGERLDSIIQHAFDRRLVGLEWAGGLPGTVGAAIRGNVGAFGGEVKDSFHHSEVLKIEYKGKSSEVNGFDITTLNRRDIKFAYRTSTVKTHKNLVVISGAFKLNKANENDLKRARQTYFANIEYRNTRHPMDLPSNGSAFKNIHDPEQIKAVLEIYPDIEEKVRVDWHGKVSVGYLIKRLDLSGFRIGGAEISHKHSNFIVNTGGAKFTDVVGVIRKVQNTFEDTFGFTPEPEVEIVE